MKQLITLILLLILFTSAHAQDGQPAFLETLKPVERVHHFGKIYEKDGKKTHVFQLVNTGKQPVTISRVNTTCGCMVASYTKTAIKPGGRASVSVTLDPDHKEGTFVKSVSILLNNDRQYVRLWVKAQIEPMEHPVQESHPYAYGYGLWMNQQLLPFPDLKVGSDHSYTVKLANATDKPMTIVFDRRPNNRVLKMPHKLTLKPRERTTMQVSYHYYRKHQQTGYVAVYPIINGHRGKPLKLRWNVGEDFQLLQ